MQTANSTLTPFCCIRTGVQHGLTPVVAEDYGKHEEGLSSYAVALIKANLTAKKNLNILTSITWQGMICSLGVA